MAEFKYALLGRPETFNPVDASSERSNHVSWLISETLFDVRGTLEAPVVQKSRLVDAVYPDPPAGKTLTVTLKPELFQGFFDDPTRGLAPGKVDASKIAQILRGYQNSPKHKGKLFRLLVKNFRPDGGNNQILHLELNYESYNYFSQIQLIDTSGSVPRGTGPFKYLQLDPIVLERNPDYRGPWPGNIDRVSFTAYKTPQEISVALDKGDAHFTPALELSTLPHNVERIEKEALNLFYLGLDTKYKPFNDPLVRRAVADAVNVNEVVNIARKNGLKAIAAQGPLPPPMRDDLVSQFAYAPEKAKNLLHMAGYDSATDVPLFCHGVLNNEIAGYIAEGLQQVGIKVRVLQLSTWDELLANVRAGHGHLFLYSWHVRWPFHERFLLPLFHSELSEVTNLTRYDDKAFDKNLERALGLQGQDQLNAYSLLQQKIVDDVPMVCLYHTKRMAAYRRDLLKDELVLNPGALPASKLVDVTVK
jgi:ABC-type oligopeptide transport system substrate-binding subunit